VSGGGGKGGSSSSTVSIPPEVLARYNAVNAQAEKLGGTDAAGNPNTPFQPYSTDPNAFVAPLTPTQQSGIANTNASAGAAQPWYQRAGGLAAASAQNVNPQQYSTGQIAQYMNPFAQQVIGGTLAPLQQQQAQDRQNLISSNIRGGAFGGDRAAIADAALRGQQEMATGNVVGGLLTPMYNQAQQEFNTQQGVNLAAQQANRQNYQTAAGLLGNLGTGAQTAALTGAQAQLSAGQQQQQTHQAGLTALYNQFLQQQSYPFQTTQFLANIAEGTGALSGSTTTGQQSGGFFSDERVKEDIEQIGETYDGQKIIKFRYKGDKGPKQIGLSAQDVERHHPHAVGDYHGIKTVNYDEATKDSAHRGHFYSGGLASMGGAALDTGTRENFDIGGMPDPSLAYGRPVVNPYGGLGGAPQAAVPTSRNIMTGNMPAPRGLMQANLPQRQQSGLSQATSFGKDVAGLMGSRGTKDTKTGQYAGGSGLIGAGQGIKDWMSEDPKKTDITDTTDRTTPWRGGRMGYATEGEVEDPPELPEAPKPTDQFKPEQDDPLAHQKKGLTIPDDNPQAKLNPAQLPSGGGGGGGLGSLLGGAGSFMSGAAKIAPFFLASGGLAGREHHAKGDSAGDDTPTVQAYNVPADPVAALHDINDQNNLPSGFMPRLAQIESRMGQNVYNPKSGASGWFQHIPSTAKARGIDPLDFQQSSADAAKMASENRSYLRQNAGIEDPTGAHLYLAHQQGPSGAAALLSNGDKSAIDALAPIYAKRIGDPDRARSVATAAVLNNGGTQDMSASDFAARVMGMYSGAKVPTGLGISGGKKQLAPLDEGTLGAIQKLPGIGSLAKSEDQGGLSEQTKLALLGGLGGMLASPNRTLLGALGSGITSGVETYQGMGGLGVQQKQAETTARSADVVNAARLQALAKGALFTHEGKEYAVLKSGQFKRVADLQPSDELMGGSEAAAAVQRVGGKLVSGGNEPYSTNTGAATPSVGVAPQPAKPDTNEYQFLGDEGRKQAEKNYQDVFINGDKETRAQELGQSQTAYKTLQANAEDARRAGDTLNQITRLVVAAPQEGLMSLGPNSSNVRSAIGQLNDLARRAGASDLVILPEEVGKQAAQEKLAKMQQFQSTSNAGQHSIAALQTAAQIVATPDLSREAALELIAGNQISKQKELDLQNYVKEYVQHTRNTHPGMPQSYALVHDAIMQFRKDNDEDKYTRDKEALVDMLSKRYTNDDGTESPLIEAKNAKREQLINKLYEKNHGAKNIYRYIRNI
jgi:hypothetical protein